MRLTTTALILIIVVTICSIFVANVTNLINNDHGLISKIHLDGKNKSRSVTKIDNKNDNLMWFIQISDLHISVFSDMNRVDQLREFASKTVDAINPSVVIASGDLTDARGADFLSTFQNEEEWKIYHNILVESNIKNKTVWLDIRGNHDNFNVAGINASNNYFNRYSIQGSLNNHQSYLYQLTKNNTKYSFIGMDACLEPGPKRPFNFIGFLDSDNLETLVKLVQKSRETGGDFIIWFGHYPTSCILAPGIGPRGPKTLLGEYKEGLVYLCGHLHTVGGIIPHMYTLQKEGFLELELGDWKAKRLYRVAAIDHGLFSFIDVHHDEWPIILLTNPKNPLYRIPMRENLELQKESSHIRVLAFSLSQITICRIKIDKEEWLECERVTENLFVLPWNPKIYNSKVHEIQVQVIDIVGREKTIKQLFSNGDEYDMKFGTLARFVLMTDTTTIFKTLFWILFSMCVLPLVILRIFHHLVSRGTIRLINIKCLWIKRLICKVWIMASINRIVIPYIAYLIYLTVGPISFGEVVDNHISVVFLWGIYVKQTFLPGTLSYLYVAWQLLLCQFPLIFIFSNSLYCQYRKYLGAHDILLHERFIKKVYRNKEFIVVMFVEFGLWVLYWTHYGFLAMLFDPLRTWSMVLNFILWYQIQNLPEELLRPVAEIWRNGYQIDNIDREDRQTK